MLELSNKGSYFMHIKPKKYFRNLEISKLKKSDFEYSNCIIVFSYLEFKSNVSCNFIEIYAYEIYELGESQPFFSFENWKNDQVIIILNSFNKRGLEELIQDELNNLM